MHIRLSLILLFLIFAFEGYAAVIDRVELSGNKRVPVSRVSAYMLKPGSEFDIARINNSIKLIHGTGYFSEVNADLSMEGNELVLTYIVQEVPLVGSVEYRGNKELSENKLSEITSVKRGEPLSFPKIGYTIQSIISEYEKKQYYNVQVSHRIEYINEGSVNVVFDITEGDTARVYNIWFVGNHSFTDEELRDVIRTKEKDFWSRLNSTGTLESQMLEIDAELMRMFYNSKGYINAEIGAPEIVFQEDNPDRMNYIIRIKEGDKFTVGSINYSDPSDMFSSAELEDATKLRVGDDFDVTQFRDDISSMVSLYTEKGYADAYIDDKVEINPVLKKVDISYTINCGDQYRINRIIMKGNTKTYDNVLRREFDISEGDIHNSALIKEAERNIYATGYFDSVNITEKHGDKYTDIIVNVKETERVNSISFAVMYTSENALSGKVDFALNNIFGTGRELALSAEMGRYKNDFRLKFFEPWLFDRPYSAGFTLYSIDKEYDYFDRDAFGAEITIGHQLVKRRLFMSYTIGHDESDIKNVSANASNYIKKQEGFRTQNFLLPRLTYSYLDNNVDPKDGIKSSLGVEYSGTFLGGDTHIVKATLDGSYYRPLPYGFIGAIHAEIGQIWPLTDDDIPIDKRFYLGGMYSVRGFGYQDISPVDSEGDPYGGDKYYQLNVELWRPIVEGAISVRGVVFFDLGMVYEEGQNFFSIAPRKSAGAGIRLSTPMGLIRLEYGFKLDKKPGESSGQFEFSIGNVW